MSAQLAAIVCGFGVLGLYALDRDRRDRLSTALWLPIVWLSIGSSRNIGEWLQTGGSAGDAAGRYLEGNPIDRAILTGFLVAGIVVLVRRGPRVGTLLRANALLLVYFAYCALSILWSDYPFVAFKRWNRGLGDLVMVLIILSDRDWISALRNVLSRVSFVLVPVSVLLIRYFPQMGRAYSRYEGRMFFTGASTDKNGLGMICLIFGLSSLWCLLSAMRSSKSRLRTRRLIAHGTILIMVAWLIHKADSATSLACLVLAGGLLILTSSIAAARRTAFVTAAIMGAVSFILYAVFLDSRGSLVGALGRDATLTGRTAVWELVLHFVGNPWIGSGFESFWLGRRLESILLNIPGLNEAHNGYLEVYLNLGWIGVVLLFLIIVSGFRTTVSALSRDANVGPIRLAYFVVGVLYNLTEAGFKMMSPIWITFLVSSFVATTRRPIPHREVQNRTNLGPAHRSDTNKTAPMVALVLERR